MIVRLTDVCDFQGGSQPPKSEWSESPKDGFVRMLQIRDFTQENENHIAYVKESRSLKKCNQDDVLLGRYGASVGKILTGLEGAYNVAIIKSIPNEKLLSKQFLYYHFKSPQFQNFINNVAVRAAQAGFNKEDLSQYYFELPSLSNQIKIATLLKKTEDLIQKRKDSIDLLDELVRSTFLEMFGDPVINQKEFPYMSLTEICDKITDGTHHSPPVIDQGIPYITAKHIKENFIDFESKPWYVSKEDHRDIYSRCDPKPNDILYIKDGATTGIAAINRYEFEFSMLSSVALLRVGNTCTPEFVLSWLNNPRLRENEIKGMSGAAIQRFTLSKIKEFKLFVPPLDLQNKYSGLFKKYEVIREHFIESKKELENLYNSLSQRAFNGELDLSKVEIDHLLPKEESKSDNPDLIPTVANTPPKKLSALEEEQAFIQQRKSEMYDFTDLLGDAVGAGKKGKQKLRSKLDAFLTGAQISKIIQDHFSGVHFTAEMLQHFLNTQKLATVQYTGNKELRENPKIDLVQDIPRILEQVLHVTDPDQLEDPRHLKLEQVFYNGLNPDFELQIREEDQAFTANKTPEQLSGIYFKVKA